MTGKSISSLNLGIEEMLIEEYVQHRRVGGFGMG
jgi:hypothetical protein